MTGNPVVNGYPHWDGGWTKMASRRRGDDVWLPANAAAAWLGGKFKIVETNKAVKIVRGDQWVEAAVGSRQLLVSTGAVQLMPYECDQEQGRVYSTSVGAATMVSLRSVVAAFGGTVTYVPSRNAAIAAITASPIGSGDDLSPAKSAG